MVATDAPLSLSFSAPLDTTVAFDLNDGFYLAAQVYPETGDPLFVNLSDDGTTVEIGFAWQPDTQYYVLLSGAVSDGGAPLDRPYGFSFATGTALPTATVSGTVDFGGDDPTGAVVFLLPAIVNPTFVEDGDEILPAAWAVITDNSGNYTVPYVPPDDYLIAVGSDLNGDGDPGDSFEDDLSLYDPDLDHLSDHVVVSDGEKLVGIDLTQGLPTPQTARAAFVSVEPLIDGLISNAKHKFTIGEVRSDGLSSLWLSIFRSGDNGPAVAVFSLGATNAVVGYSGTDFMGNSLSSLWIDSDQAVGIAGENGGDDFLNIHPDADVCAVLTPLPDVPGEEIPSGWVVTYDARDSDESLTVIMDAVTGELAGGAHATNALFNRDAAEAAAIVWALDATLVAISSETDLNVNGEAKRWLFDYLSGGMGSGYRVRIEDSNVLDELPMLPDTMISIVPIPDGWINSSEAISVADLNSGNFRQNHPDAVVLAVLAMGLRAGDPNRTLWRMTYTSSQDDVQTEVDVDALSGLVITGIGRLGADVPAEDVLGQNYPNPFSLRTQIPISLSEAGHVGLKIYNILGQTVGRLVDGWFQPGRYVYEWDARDLPGGLYLVHLETQKVRRTRTIVVQR